MLKEVYYIAYREKDGQKQYAWQSLNAYEFDCQREVVINADHRGNAFAELDVEDIIDRGISGLFYYLNYEIEELDATDMCNLIFQHDALDEVRKGINSNYYFKKLQ